MIHMTEITTYRTSIPSLATTTNDEAIRNIGLVNEIKEGDEVNYANSALAREELDLLIAHHSKDPVTFNKNLGAKLKHEYRRQIACILYPEAAPQAATLEGIMEQIEAMRAEFRADLGTLRADVGTLRVDMGTLRVDMGTLRAEIRDGFQALNDRISLTNAQVMNITIKKNNSKRMAKGLPPIPTHKVVPGSGFQKALTLCAGTNVTRRTLEDKEAQIGDAPNYPASWQHKEILDLIIFYNDDFGIQAHMDLDTRQRRMHAYLLH